MITKQPLQNNLIVHRLKKLKGISWMVNSNGTTPSFADNNSSHIDQHFKIFKEKDQKKKWKKKNYRKFQSVANQIENNIRHKINIKQNINLDLQKQNDSKHIPHLKHSQSFSFLSQIMNQKMKNFHKQKFNSSLDKKKPQSILAQKKSSICLKNKVQHLFEQFLESQNQIYRLRKAFAEKKNETDKIVNSKNILKIHSKQKEFIDKRNDDFFKKEIQWLDNKVSYYNKFDIHEYEKQLIRQRCLKGDKK